MKTLKSFLNHWLVDCLMFGIVLGLLITHAITGLDVSRVLWIVTPYIFVAMMRAKIMRDRIEGLKDLLKSEGYEESPDNPDEMIFMQ